MNLTPKYCKFEFIDKICGPLTPLVESKFRLIHCPIFENEEQVKEYNEWAKLKNKKDLNYVPSI